MLVRVVGAILLITTSTRRGCATSAQGDGDGPFALFIGKNAIFAILTVGSAICSRRTKGLPNVLIIMGVLILPYVHHHPHDHRTPHLRDGREPAGGAAFRRPHPSD
jgi:putative multiple sugar transport system permease protein